MDLNWTEALEKLAAYEDTGLTPEEVEIMRENKADAQFMLAELCGFCDYDRLCDLAQADKDGRLVVLPYVVRGIPYEEREKIYMRAVMRYGADAQAVVAIEELSELQKEICKYFRGRDNRDQVAEEIADVSIMLEQLKIIFDNGGLVEWWIGKKVERLLEKVCKDEVEVESGGTAHGAE